MSRARTIFIAWARRSSLVAFFHLAFTALRADSLRSSSVMLAVRRLASATAAGFFLFFVAIVAAYRDAPSATYERLNVKPVDSGTSGALDIRALVCLMCCQPVRSGA